MLKRGYYKEMAKIVQHVFYVFALTVLCMFAVMESATYSRIALFLMAGYYLLISYGVRLFWKKFLKRRSRNWAALLCILSQYLTVQNGS